MLYVQAVLLQKQSQINESRYSHSHRFQCLYPRCRDKIRETLSASNGSLSHTQLSAAALNVLASTYLEATNTAVTSQACTFLKSSLVLTYRSDDFFCKRQALNFLAGRPLNTHTLPSTYHSQWRTTWHRITSTKVTIQPTWYHKRGP